jgi:hypothetical protein
MSKSRDPDRRDAGGHGYEARRLEEVIRIAEHFLGFCRRLCAGSGRAGRDDVARLLPAKTKTALDDPVLAGVYAASDTNVYVIGNGSTQDAGGPVVILHYDGHAWTKLASYAMGNPFGITPDGAGGLWIPVGWAGGGTILHYSRGAITATALPNPGKDESTHPDGCRRLTCSPAISS